MNRKEVAMSEPSQKDRDEQIRELQANASMQSVTAFGKALNERVSERRLHGWEFCFKTPKDSPMWGAIMGKILSTGWSEKTDIQIFVDVPMFGPYQLLYITCGEEGNWHACVRLINDASASPFLIPGTFTWTVR